MKKPLKKFTDFTLTLLPHEVAYLCRIEQFADPANRAILERILHNTRFPNKELPFDLSIDKRKYSKLKKWIQTKLGHIDVDREVKYIQETEYAILTDDISPAQEKKLIKKMGQYGSSRYHFMRFYELVERYRQFLLIRMRYKEHDLSLKYIQTHEKAYAKAKKTYRRLYEITQDIVDQYRTGSKESKQWEEWLTGIFQDDSFDGLNRYTALVRLTFIHFNYRDFVGLLPLYEHLDELLQQGKFYSRNILANYYSNRVILHSKKKEWSKAERYGYLSIKHLNKDYLHYVNTLVGILLRQGKYQDALKLMQKAFPAMKDTNSFHSKSGFISFYIRTLLLNKRTKEACRFAENFLDVYEKQLLNQRWHTFFSFYLETLIVLEEWDKILELNEKYQLLERDQAYRKKGTYLPTLYWYIMLAKLKTKVIVETTFEHLLADQINELGEGKRPFVKDIIEKLKPYYPKVFRPLMMMLHQSKRH